MLLIRHLQASDSIESLTALLHRAYAPLGRQGLNYTAVDQSPQTTADRLAGGQCFVAEWRGQLAGTIVAKPPERLGVCEYFTRPNVATARQFGVEPGLQGNGIGRALLDTCEAWATEHAYRELALDTAEPAVHLVRLYARLGFTQVGFVHWPGKVYRSVVMSKVLDRMPPA